MVAPTAFNALLTRGMLGLTIRRGRVLWNATGSMQTLPGILLPAAGKLGVADPSPLDDRVPHPANTYPRHRRPGLTVMES